ncbi:hypothetical protein ARAF_0643 [Arsenophonus endosymbiont of Aleurodicus floccissimus]|uniref:hypothetical protein n=1 Tax=Arsenophonus endosymbiont of Aleurodicus floccissimus TaxID=2152761 RepID=UPI000E6B4641|nr:hypothetical protein [Arsenophonus endosymbiont of Aleurodicus floccissimus]SPP31514.1 hypothetical protein ARAF_0643 [Arsenophonus endosymbiont of Aleurodicus floccissimus]
MNERELSLLEAIGEAVTDVLAKQEVDLVEKINSVKKHVDEQILNLKQEIKNKEIVINEKILEAKTKNLIEEPAIERPELSLLDIEQLINAKIADVVQSVSAEKLPDIHAFITDAIDKLPKPKDGKDADPKIVAKALLEIIPKPQDGKDGKNGKDALNIELLPSIDESRSYPRGTFATHRGDIWRSFQQTTGMHGWECVVNGHYTESEEFKDARTLSIRSEMSNGPITTSEYTIPTMIYGGIYSIEKEYQTGDVVYLEWLTLAL